MRYLAESMPDPPRRGWWLDPADPTLMRYHDGKRWGDRTVSSVEPVDGGDQSFGSLWHTSPLISSFMSPLLFLALLAYSIC
jgi:hypothetical protein